MSKPPIQFEDAVKASQHENDAVIDSATTPDDLILALRSALVIERTTCRMLLELLGRDVQIESEMEGRIRVLETQIGLLTQIAQQHGADLPDYQMPASH